MAAPLRSHWTAARSQAPTTPTPVLIAATTPQADGSALFQTENQTLDLVFSEPLGASISEVNLELALTFAGGAIDGDNLPTLGTGANPIALTTTTVANDTLRITFNTNNTPNLDWLRVGTHTVQVADGTNLDDVPGNDGNTTSPAVTITGVANTAPVLTPATPNFTTITEDDVANPGDLVSTLLGASVADANFFPVEGIAVTGLVSSNGTWEYNTGSGWNPVGAVSDASALLLAADDRLRFVPDTLNADAGSVTYRAWDQTGGTYAQVGTKVNTAPNGGSTPYSTNTDMASITVTAVNDLPVAAADDYGTNENTALVVDALSGVLANDTDVDPDTLSAILVTDVSNGALALAADGSFTYTPNPAFNGVDTFTYKVNDGTADGNTVSVDIKVGEGPIITARETVDSDNDGQIDQIRITTDVSLNDNFGDLVIHVNGVNYSAAGHVDRGHGKRQRLLREHPRERHARHGRDAARRGRLEHAPDAVNGGGNAMERDAAPAPTGGTRPGRTASRSRWTTRTPAPTTTSPC